MSDTIQRAECPECGIFFAIEAAGRACIDVYGDDGGCDGVLVERTYVATDALLSDEAIDVAVAFAVTQPGGMAEAIRAAIAAVTETQMPGVDE